MHVTPPPVKSLCDIPMTSEKARNGQRNGWSSDLSSMSHIAARLRNTVPL